MRFVTVTDGGWDTHQNNFTSLKGRLLPRLDAALSGLLQDLSDRGLLESTLVVVLSDFGRTPKVNPSAGRDHWSTAGIALLAGGGLRPATVVGQTDAQGEQPTEAPYFTEDVAATIYHCLGIPLDTTHQTPDGRPIQDQRRRAADPRAGLSHGYLATEARDRCTMRRTPARPTMTRRSCTVTLLIRSAE